MQWLTEYFKFHEAENSRQKERHGKMSDVHADVLVFMGGMCRVLESKEEQSFLNEE